MRIPALLPTVFMASVTASTLDAQVPPVGPGVVIAPGARSRLLSNHPRAIIGVSTTNGTTSRDTLGILVSSVRAGSPAEKAGVEEGNRIASINGVNLKLSAGDVGDDQMADVMSRRLQRELDRLRPGDDVDLTVHAGGAPKDLKVKTVSPSDLYETAMRRDWDDRPTLGISLATTGSSRDSIGVFVMAVDDNSPAAKAGIEEGARIASINGVDLRGRRSSEEDGYFNRASNANRFERELARAKPGDDVELRVYDNGQFKNVKVKAARMSDFPRRTRSVTIVGGGGDALVLPEINRMKLDGLGPDISDRVRRVLDEVRVSAGRGSEGFGRGFSGTWGGRIDW